MSGNTQQHGANDQVIHKHRKFAKRKVTFYLDPRLIEEAEKSAAFHGYESVSGLIEGHLLLGMIWESANPGKKHSYTVDVVNDPDRFEKEFADLKTNPPKSWGSWMSRQVEGRGEAQP